MDNLFLFAVIVDGQTYLPIFCFGYCLCAVIENYGKLHRAVLPMELWIFVRRRRPSAFAQHTLDFVKRSSVFSYGNFVISNLQFFFAVFDLTTSEYGYAKYDSENYFKFFHIISICRFYIYMLQFP